MLCKWALVGLNEIHRATCVCEMKFGFMFDVCSCRNYHSLICYAAKQKREGEAS